MQMPFVGLPLPLSPFVYWGESEVIKFRPREIYLAASYMRPVLELPDESDRKLVVTALVCARMSFSCFTGDLIERFLPSSKRRAEWIIETIDKIVFEKRDDDGLPSVGQLQTMLRQFETVLDEELSAAPIFCLERIGNLSTESLLEGASTGFDPEAIAKLPPTAVAEIDEAGKCLAFERATASAFHILRAVELAIKTYLSCVPGFVLPPMNRQNWGEFIKLLQDNGSAKEVTDALQNIKSNYRNPLMHPEDTLDLRHAIGLFSVCQGMIEVLIADMKKRGIA